MSSSMSNKEKKKQEAAKRQAKEEEARKVRTLVSSCLVLSNLVPVSWAG